MESAALYTCFQSVYPRSLHKAGRNKMRFHETISALHVGTLDNYH